MSSTATARLRFEKQGTGDNSGTWGNKLNTTGLDLIDAAIMGVASYTLSGTKTLTTNNYAADEARMPFQNITGGTGGTITIPSSEGRWFFRNNASGNVIVTTGSGTTATLSSGDATAVHCDGTNVYTGLTKSYVDAAIAAAALGGITNLPASQGGTGNTSYTVGDILFASGVTTLAKLAAVATGNVLRSGGVGTAPAWGKVVLTTDVSGTLAQANGGTGTTSATGSGANVLATSPTLANATLTTPTLTSPVVTGTATAPTQTAGDNSTKLATTAYVDTARGWTQIATSTPSGTGTVTFSSIPATYSELLLVIAGASHNDASSRTLNLSISPDGAAFGAAAAVSPSVAAAAVVHGGVMIPAYTKDCGVMTGTTSSISSPAVDNSSGALSNWRCTGGITAIRAAWTAGNYDAGTLTLYGR